MREFMAWIGVLGMVYSLIYSGSFAAVFFRETYFRYAARKSCIPWERHRALQRKALMDALEYGFIALSFWLSWSVLKTN